VRRVATAAVAVALATLASGCATLFDWSPKVTHLPSYSCPRATTPIVIDGALSEAAWDQARTIKEFSIPVTRHFPLQKSEAKLLWDDKNLYVAFKTYDEDIWGLFTDRDASTCREDVQEIFFSTDESDSYYNFEINALGTVYDGYQFRPRAGMWHRWRKWNCEGLKVASKVQGTLNNWEDKDEYWQLEVAIPFADLPSMKGAPPKPGDVWTFHLARYDHSVYLEESPELVSCAPLSICSFHHFEDWIPLVFEGGK